MAKKKNGNNENENNGGGMGDGSGGGGMGDGSGGGGDGGKKYKVAGVTVVVLKMDLHCEGCAGRVVKAVRTLDGVESVRIGDSELNKLTIIGNVDPIKLRQKVEEKTKKKVELVSPAGKKTADGDTATTQCDGGGGGDGKKKQQKTPENNKDEKTTKELPVITAVLKVPLHCQGCIQKIHKLVRKTKGYMEMSLDKEKDLVIVKGAIDMKILKAALQSKLKRVVEIVPSKKDGGDGEKKVGAAGGGGEKKGKGEDGNDGEGKGSGNGGGGEKKGKGCGGGGGGNDGGGKAEVHKMDNYGGSAGYPYPYPQYTYGPGYTDYVHAPQLFSDDNPNACVVM